MSKTTLMNMCMICDDAGRVLVQNKINSRWAGITFPGGHVDDGESLYESTVREVKEETGLTVTDLKLVGLIHMYDPENHDRRMIYLYRASRFEGEIVDETSEGKVFWVSLDKLGDVRLAPNMREYLRVFLHDDVDDVIEAYVTPDRGFAFYP